MLEDMSFNLFAMEQEGLLFTRESKIRRAIKTLREYYQKGYNLNAIGDTVLIQCGLIPSELTDTECKRIKYEVEKT